MSETSASLPKTGAESLLLGLKTHGVDYLFANAGTDFPPIIEALVGLPGDLMPEPVTVPHETAGVAMAHGYYLVTGRPQAVMVHVNVGLANAAMGVINAASDNVPVLVMSGRTPITETGHKGSRMTPIQYGQEMFNQASLVADVVKYQYEMRYPEQGEPLVARALAIATSAPQGPVYLSLPREPLSADIAEGVHNPVTTRKGASASHPDPLEVASVAALVAAAKHPLILVQRGDTAGRLSAALQSLASDHAIAVCEPFMVRNTMPTAHPMNMGGNIKAALAVADLVIVLDCDIPWIEAMHRPAADIHLIHVGPDPHFARMPVRGYRTDMAIKSDPAAFVMALAVALPKSKTAPDRFAAISAANAARRAAAMVLAEQGKTDPISTEWLSKCLSDAMDEDALVFGELGIQPDFMDVKGPNRLFLNSHSGGLGWAIPAALGAQLADRNRLVTACIGDGSYIFANPVACHQISAALGLPILTIIKNNGMWNAVRRSVVNAYPDGLAARANTMPLTSLAPAPDYLKVAAASDAYTARVTHGRDLPEALSKAINVIRTEKRQAVLDVRVAISDAY